MSLVTRSNSTRLPCAGEEAGMRLDNAWYNMSMRRNNSVNLFNNTHLVTIPVRPLTEARLRQAWSSGGFC